jgi:hypothetical protein
MKRRAWILGLVALALLAVLGACTSKRETPTASAPTSSTTGSKPGSAASPSAPTTKPAVEVTASGSPAGVEVTVDVAVPPPEGVFAQSAAALAALQSYRYTTTFSFTGEEGGKPESGSVEVRGAVAAPDRQRITWRDLEAGEEFGLLRIGGRAWILDGAEWTAVPSLAADAASQAVLVYVPSMSWSQFAEGMGPASTYVGSEVVNGIPSRHYASTYRGWAEHWQGELTDVSADVWIAAAGYPVRYRFAATGIDEDGDRGSMLWTMELSDVDGPVSIDAPQ